MDIRAKMVQKENIHLADEKNKEGIHIDANTMEIKDLKKWLVERNSSREI